MRIKDKLDYDSKPKPFTLSPETMIIEALNEMCEKNFGSVIIVNKDDTIAGILTERDMMIRVLHKGLDPKKTAIKDVMSTDILVAKEEDDLLDWLRTMSNERFRHLPIVDENNTLVTMMSQGDFLSYTWPDAFEQARKSLRHSLGMPFQIIMSGVAILIVLIFFLEAL